MATIEVVTADITTLSVDAIVNAANKELLEGGGVCGAIFDAAGSVLLQEACDEIGGCDVGCAVATPSYALEAHGISTIIHAVGPIWNGDEQQCDRLLASAYRESLLLADRLTLRSIAFPAISTGIYGFPPERAGRIAVKTVREHSSALETVLLVAFDARSASLLEAALDGLD